LEAILEFAQGPLFRLTFALMVLGLLRILFLDIWGIAEAYGKAADKKVPWRLTFSRTVEWLVPIKRLLHNRPVYSVVSILFHVGLILVPIFLYAHVELWRSGLGFGWPTLPKVWADWLTILTVATALMLLIGRIGSAASRFLSRKQDYAWPIILMVPFATGYVCANMGISAGAYQWFMLIHVLSAEVIFVLIPFTKIAHCVLQPLGSVVSAIAWRFPPETDDEVCSTLNKKGAPV
jgi:nitrate reductase gamma subunit